MRKMEESIAEQPHIHEKPHTKTRGHLNNTAGSANSRGTVGSKSSSWRNIYKGFAPKKHRKDMVDHESYDRSFQLPQMQPADDSDQQSTWSGDGQEKNEYNLMAEVEGPEGGVGVELLTSLDTQSRDNVIFRSALAKLGGQFKEHHIPRGKVIAIQSPLDPSKSTILKKFVNLQLYFSQIGCSVKVRLKIVEVSEEPSGFQAILGREFIRKYNEQDGGNWFLKRVTLASANDPNPYTSSFGPFLRVAKKSKKQREFEKDRMRTAEFEQHQAHARLYPKRDTVPSTQTQVTSTSNGSRSGDRGVNYSTGYSYSLRYQLPNHLLSSYGRPAEERATGQSTAKSPTGTEWHTRRTDTLSSQSTQSTKLTGYSVFSKAETWDSFSSISSSSDVPSYSTKERRKISRLGARQENSHY